MDDYELMCAMCLWELITVQRVPGRYIRANGIEGDINTENGHLIISKYRRGDLEPGSVMLHFETGSAQQLRMTVETFYRGTACCINHLSDLM